jgi:hypothetical protein
MTGTYQQYGNDGVISIYSTDHSVVIGTAQLFNNHTMIVTFNASAFDNHFVGRHPFSRQSSYTVTPADLYGRWLGPVDNFTFVISANRLRFDYPGEDNKGGYEEVTINSWEAAVNTDTSKGTYPAGYTITGKVTAASSGESVGSTFTETFYLSNDRNAFLWLGLVFVRQ